MSEKRALERVGFLAALSDTDLRELLLDAKRIQFRKDQEILAQGYGNASLFVVLEGLLHVRRRVGGRDVFLGRLEAGSFFGELSLFDPAPTTAAVQALSDGVVLEISRACLDQFLTRHPAAGAQLLRTMLKDVSSRLRRADERLSDSVVWGGLLHGGK
jgi:CRP/FNR family cyclic AMP-dependent transcriptional regulator